MKVKITALKAPWPEGAGLGSIVEFEGKAPAWAVGKFVQVEDNADAEFHYEPQLSISGDGSGTVLPSIDAVNLAVAELQQQLAHAEGVNAVLQAELEDRRAELSKVTEAARTSEARIAALEAEKAKVTDVDAQADAEKSRLALEAEAKELGVSFHPNLGDDKLRERIAEARAKK
jgi:hypothetical protein